MPDATHLIPADELEDVADALQSVPEEELGDMAHRAEEFDGLILLDTLGLSSASSVASLEEVELHSKDPLQNEGALAYFRDLVVNKHKGDFTLRLYHDEDPEPLAHVRSLRGTLRFELDTQSGKLVLAQDSASSHPRTDQGEGGEDEVVGYTWNITADFVADDRFPDLRDLAADTSVEETVREAARTALVKLNDEAEVWKMNVLSDEDAKWDDDGDLGTGTFDPLEAVPLKDLRYMGTTYPKRGWASLIGIKKRTLLKSRSGFEYRTAVHFHAVLEPRQASGSN